MDFNLELLNFCCVLLLIADLALPGLFISAFFQDSALGSIGDSVLSWILTIVIYSVIAFFVALIFSLYTPLDKQHETGHESTERS